MYWKLTRENDRDDREWEAKDRSGNHHYVIIQRQGNEFYGKFDYYIRSLSMDGNKQIGGKTIERKSMKYAMKQAEKLMKELDAKYDNGNGTVIKMPKSEIDKMNKKLGV